MRLVGAVGIEPTTFGLKGRCSTTELRPYIYMTGKDFTEYWEGADCVIFRPFPRLARLNYSRQPPVRQTFAIRAGTSLTQRTFQTSRKSPFGGARPEGVQAEAGGLAGEALICVLKDLFAGTTRRSEETLPFSGVSSPIRAFREMAA